MKPAGDALRLRPLWLGIGLFAAAGLLFLSLMPVPPRPIEFDHVDKLEHFAVYCMLAAWFAAALAPRHHFKGAVALVVYGAAIEGLQAMTAYRHGHLYDLIANTLGVAAGTGFAVVGGMTWLGYIDARVAAAGNRAR